MTGGRAFLTVDEPDGWAVWITNGGSGRVHPEEERAPLPAGVSHLLAANDALIRNGGQDLFEQR